MRQDLASALRDARRRARPGELLSVEHQVADPDAVLAFRAVRAAGQDAALWLRPDEGTALLAVGNAATLAAGGRERIGALRRGWSELRASAADPLALRAFVGFSFDERPVRVPGPSWEDFPRALLVVPRLLIEWRGGRALARAAARADDRAAEQDLEGISAALAAGASDPQTDPGRLEGSGELPARERWRADVARTRDEVRGGLLDKLVLARTVRLRPAAGRAEVALGMLARHAPGCTVYAVGRGRSLLVGATPETLVGLAGGTARVSCVAGTAPRSDGDATVPLALMRSEKERAEHAFVVDAALRALAATCDDVSSGSPRLMALATLWHLASEVSGRARPSVEVLDLAAALHPTPAVCGVPREDAARVLAEREPFDRGWYGGALGWIDGRGDGELVVALRCALARGDEVWLFAGCGIVAGSDPDAELAESDAKLRPMLAALGAL